MREVKGKKCNGRGEDQKKRRSVWRDKKAEMRKIWGKDEKRTEETERRNMRTEKGLCSNLNKNKSYKKLEIQKSIKRK